MTKLISDEFCVAVSGPTIDGREIRASWLKDMAETYDSKTYEAMMWYEHYRFPGNFGSLYSVRAEKGDDGLYRLYNRLIPSPRMQEMNQEGQKLHTSIEVLTEFRGKKKAYQYGLGITDSPASIGTDRLSFSAGSQPSADELKLMVGVCNVLNAAKVEDYKQRVKGVNPDHLEIFVSQPLPDLEFKKEKSYFDFSNLGGLFGRNNNDTTEEGTDMTKDETAALIDEKLSSFGEQLIAKIAEQFGTKNDSEPAESTESAEFDDKLLGAMESLGAQFSELKTAIENTPNQFSGRPEAVGGTDENQFDS